MSELIKVPSGLSEHNIGRVVKVQVFRLNGSDTDGDTINTESLEKYVGILKGYYHDKNGLIIKLDSFENIVTAWKKHHVEVYL